LRILIPIDNVYGFFDAINLRQAKHELMSWAKLLVGQLGGWMSSKPAYKEEPGQKFPPALAI